MLKVSVIIPIYNHEKYIAQAIQSILDQTFQDFEIIIIDDASTDKTVSVVKNFRDPRIQFFSVPRNQGTSKTINEGLARAKGEYIALLGSDDIAMPDRLEKQVAFLDQNPLVGAVLSRAHIIGENGEPFENENHFYANIFNQENRSRFEWLRYFFYKRNCLCHPASMVRKTVHEDIGVYDLCYLQLHDFDFWVRLCLKYEIYVFEDKLIKYRVRDNQMNISSARWENIVRGDWEYRYILKHFYKLKTVDELLKTFPELKDQYKSFKENLLSYYIVQLCLSSNLATHKFSALEMLYELLQTDEKQLYEEYSFSYPDFFKLIAEKDAFEVGNYAKIIELQNELQELQELRQALDYKNQEIELILNSLSWKITKPLRSLKKLIGGKS